MSNKANNPTPLYKRIIVFAAGMPGYLLTFFPWMFVIGLIFVLSISYSQDRTFTIPYEQIPVQALNPNYGEILSIVLLASVLWVFVAWVTKRILLWLSRFFGQSEKVWQVVKLSALISGWIAVVMTDIFLFRAISRNSIISELVLVAIGAGSIGAEYILGKYLRASGR